MDETKRMTDEEFEALVRNEFTYHAEYFVSAEAVTALAAEARRARKSEADLLAALDATTEALQTAFEKLVSAVNVSGWAPLSEVDAMIAEAKTIRDRAFSAAARARRSTSEGGAGNG